MLFARKNVVKQENNLSDIQKIIQNGEPKANRLVADALILIIVIYFLTGLAFWLGLFSGYPFTSGAIFADVFFMFFSIVLCWLKNGHGSWIKYEMISVLLLSVFVMNFLSGYKLWILFSIPILISIRYYSTRFTFFTGAVAVLLTIFSAFTNAFLAASNGYMDLNTVSFSGIAHLDVSGFLYDEVLASEVAPLQILKNTLRVSTLGNCVAMLCVTFVSIALIHHAQSLLLQTEQAIAEKSAAELQLERSKIRVLGTQLQPHFLFNTLSAIMAIDGNPDETVDAIGEFGKYLRENLGSITQCERIPFLNELEHTRRYLKMEQLRFGNQLSVETDIQADQFTLPPLTVQILAENAVKHGITCKSSGGTISILSGETESEYWVSVEDDGVGFDPNAPIDTEKHFGLANLRARLELLCGGLLEIYSSQGKGTKAIVRIPK